MEPSQGTRKNNAIPGHTPPPQPSPQCFESCFTVGNLTSTHQPPKNKNSTQDQLQIFAKTWKMTGHVSPKNDQHFGHLFFVKTTASCSGADFKKKNQQKTWFFSGGIFFVPKIPCFLLKISGHFPSSNGIPHLPSLEPIAVEPIGNAQAHASRLQRNKWNRCKIMLLCFASLGSLGFQWGFSGFWLLFSILEIWQMFVVVRCERKNTCSKQKGTFITLRFSVLQDSTVSLEQVSAWLWSLWNRQASSFVMPFIKVLRCFFIPSSC